MKPSARISVQVFAAILSSALFISFPATLAAQATAQTTPQTAVPGQPHYESNFDAERKQANELYLAQKVLDALPLYEDLSRQDPTIAVFAERYGAGLLAKSSTIADPAEQKKVNAQAMEQFKRAKVLGDNSPYIQSVLSASDRSYIGAVISGFPLSGGYTYHGTPEAQAAMQQAEAAFGKSDWATAATLYVQAATLDPKWYDAALYAGDSYFRQRDTANAGAWFAKAIAIDPDRETAYRYWGDALYRSGDQITSREKFVQAVVAEPYTARAFGGLAQWAKVTGHQLVKPNITRPEFTTPNGVLAIDPALAASTADGRSSWIVYQQYRVAHGARVLNQVILGGGFDASANVTTSDYRHTIAEEHAALRAMLADIDAKIASGALTEAALDPNIRNIRNLEKADVLGACIAFQLADAGIRSDYPDYRAHHRKHLTDYVNSYLIR